MQNPLKRLLGIGFIILFLTFIVNLVISLIPFTHDSIGFHVRSWWFIASFLLQETAVILIAFNKYASSNVLAKIGAGLYTILMIFSLINQISYQISGESIIHYQGVTEYINSFILYALGLLFLMWGSKIWLPTKIIGSISVVIGVISDFIWYQITPLYMHYSDLTYEQIEYIDYASTIIGHLNSINILVNLVFVIFIIVWIYKRQKTLYTQINNIDLI